MELMKSMITHQHEFLQHKIIIQIIQIQVNLISQIPTKMKINQYQTIPTKSDWCKHFILYENDFQTHSEKISKPA